MPATAPGSAVDLPPIVLLIEPRRDDLERYSRCLEHVGMWVASTRLAEEAVAAAEELRPDIIVADTIAPNGHDDGLVESLKQHPVLGPVPVIALAPAGASVAGADTVLVKPVEGSVLIDRTCALLVQARAIRSHADDIIRRGEQLRVRSQRLIEQSAKVTSTLQQTARDCPTCHSPLEWVERAACGSSTYDYYRWCLKGCGLFCFDCGAAKWVKLA